VLEIDDVSKTFGGVRALDGCRYVAVPKRLTGLLGPNGCREDHVDALPARVGRSRQRFDAVARRADQRSRAPRPD
jgi:hypothetical protein